MLMPHCKAGFIALLAPIGITASVSGGMLPVSSSMLFSGSLGDYSTEALFRQTGDLLSITLTNTSEIDLLYPREVLTGIYFNITDNAGGEASRSAHVNLVPVSAIVSAPHTVVFGSTLEGGDVGGEWAFRDDLLYGSGGTSIGISTATFSEFRLVDRFSQVNVSGPAGVGWIDYGLIPATDDPTTGVTVAVTGYHPLIKNSITFVVQGLPEGFQLSDLRDVTAQHGSKRTNPVYSLVIPAPGAVVLFGLSAVLMAPRRRARPR